jgi:hypothetical protein
MTDATSGDPTEVLSDPTGRAIQFGGRVPRLVCAADLSDGVKMIIEQIAGEGPCPVCGELSSVVKDRPLIRVKDLPACGQTVEL